MANSDLSDRAPVRLDLSAESRQRATGRGREAPWTVVRQDTERRRTYKGLTPDELRHVVLELSKQRWNGHNPILVCGQFGFGDALMMGPAIEALHSKFRFSPIHVLCNARAACIFHHNPAIGAIVSGCRAMLPFAEVREFYHHSYEMGQWLTRNPLAHFENGYRLACETLFVAATRLTPKFYYSEEEERRVGEALDEAGILRGPNKLFLVHTEASTALRKWPDAYTRDLVQELSSSGERVIVAGEAPPPFLGDVFSPGKVVHVSRDLACLTVRERFLVTKFADIVVAVDSVYSHLAGAFGRPSVLLYGPFAGELRCQHFDGAHVIQAEVPCGPCHQHASHCQHEPEAGAPPACMRAISVAQVLEAIQDILQTPARSRPEPLVSTSAASFSGCPVCGGSSGEAFLRKKSCVYFRCRACGSLSRETTSDGRELLPAGRHLWMESSSETSLIRKRGTMEGILSVVDDLRGEKAYLALHIGSGGGTLRKMLLERMCKCDTYEPDIRIGDTATFRTIAALLESRAAYDVIFLINDIVYVSGIGKLWSLLQRKLRPDGLFVMSAPVAENCSYSEAWPLNQRRAGEYPLIPSAVALKEEAGRHGFAIVWRNGMCQRLSDVLIFRRTE